MSAAHLSHPRGGSHGATAGASTLALASPASHAIAEARAPVALAGALLVLLLYAAFSHGASTVTDGARVEVAIAAIAALAGGACLWTGTLRCSAPRLALAGAGLLAAFALWSGITVLWSVAPDHTWLELNRVLAYVVVLFLAFALGASHSRSVELIAKGFVLVALAVSVYALGQKLLPGLHIAGVFDLNTTGSVPRLQEPLGYWNALALMIAMGVPLALALALDSEGTRRMRLGALLALALMLLTLGFTYSRGGVLALVLGLLAGIALSGARLRSLMWLAVACAAALPSLVLGLTDHALTAANVGLGARETAGAVLAGVVIVSALALIAVGRTLLGLEQRVVIGPERARAIVRSLVASTGVVVVVGVLAVALSSRGIDGTVSHAWKSFTTTHETSTSDPSRLLSVDSENRWVWWKEAAGAFSDRPVAGWGAGSFGVVHLLYRRDQLSVQQPHSLPLQWLAETGLTGALLAIAGWGLLLSAGVKGVRRRPLGTERLLAAALLAGSVAFAVHACYDFDWDIPGVALPAIVLLGVLLGSSGRRADQPVAALRGPGPVTRLLSLGALTLSLCTFALSAILPSLAAGEAGTAQLTAASSSPGALQTALRAATLASGLDPLSDAGPSAQAAIAEQRGELPQARAYWLEAVRREPADVQAWVELADVELELGDQRNASRANVRALALDPLGRSAASLRSGASFLANLIAAPPADSATAPPLSRG
ncbi:MAG: hypothetical protein DLM64_15700 [Solirubrobacterales bacterium]|nr:MAG: hypothetical protein DLM64_15700 [Solirubrobacterales bacterium]